MVPRSFLFLAGGRIRSSSSDEGLKTIEPLVESPKRMPVAIVVQPNAFKQWSLDVGELHEVVAVRD